MPKSTNKELVPATSKFRDIEAIMNDPQAKATLMSAVDEAVTCKAEIAKQNAAIKKLREDALNDIQVSPKLFNAYVAVAFNNDYKKRREGLSEQLGLIEMIMLDAGILNAPDDVRPSSDDD